MEKNKDQIINIKNNLVDDLNIIITNKNNLNMFNNHIFMDYSELQ